MLLLASLLSMMAIGSIVMFEPNSASADEEDKTPEDTDTLEEGDSETPDLLSYINSNGVLETIPNAVTTGDDLLIGTATADDMQSEEGDDKLMARGGNDTADGGSGNDVIHGNQGDDLLRGGTGLDSLIGDQGADVLWGDTGADSLIGGSGDDVLNGGLGADDLIGGEGHDALWGSDGDDTLIGNAGSDTLIGGMGKDVMFAGDDNDVLSGWEDAVDSADFLNGGAGDDTIFAGANDHVDGGIGQDKTVMQANTSEPVQIWNFESEQDTLIVLYETDDGAPDITISEQANDEGKWIVSANGQALAYISGDAPVMSDINLVERT